MRSRDVSKTVPKEVNRNWQDKHNLLFKSSITKITPYFHFISAFPVLYTRKSEKLSIISVSLYKLKIENETSYLFSNQTTLRF